ncbi:MAG: HAD family hydrolase [Bacteroidia bacterium]|nr:HAD family hydrolase [Bacteroidia bacterium]
MESPFPLHTDPTWTLFLDRDGVINRRLPGDYVREWAEWEFLPGVLEAIAVATGMFARIVVVTNQRGIARGLMTREQLAMLHERFHEEVEKAGGRLDGVYYCPHDNHDGCNCRKPRPGLALQAQEQFPEIDFSRSVLLGDSASDIQMGHCLGMFSVHINAEFPEMPPPPGTDLQLPSLAEFIRQLNSGPKLDHG